MLACPRCGTPLSRVAFPAWLRPLRLLFPRLRAVGCYHCGLRRIRGWAAPREPSRPTGENS